MLVNRCRDGVVTGDSGAATAWLGAGHNRSSEDIALTIRRWHDQFCPFPQCNSNMRSRRRCQRRLCSGKRRPRRCNWKSGSHARRFRMGKRCKRQPAWWTRNCSGNQSPSTAAQAGRTGARPCVLCRWACSQNECRDQPDLCSMQP